MDGQRSLRLFLAITLDPALQTRIAALLEPFRASTSGVRFVAAPALHLTLAFLGARPVRDLEPLAAALGPVARLHAPFTMQLAGAGCFPTSRRPRVLWLGVTEGSGPVTALQRSVSDALSPAGLYEPEAPFHPHLTIGRVRDPSVLDRDPALGRRWEAQTLPSLSPLRVDAMQLMQSELGRDGARYTSLLRWPLAGSSSANERDS